MTTKKELRILCKEKRKAIENKGKKSADIAGKILAMAEVQKADTFFLFYPIKGEINLLPIAEFAWQKGKTVGFPLCEDKDGAMTFRKVGSLDELMDGSFGTKEPSPDAPLAEPMNAVIFLPALAVDKKGHRLGYGKGYYDRYLAKYADLKPFKICAIYKDLIFEEIPHDEYDIPCDVVVWEEQGLN